LKALGTRVAFKRPRVERRSRLEKRFHPPKDILVTDDTPHPRHSCAALGVTHAKRFQNLIGHLLDIVGLTSNVPDLSCSAAPDASLLAFLLLRNVRVKTNEKLLFAPSPPYKM